MDALFAIDAEARDTALGIEQRRVLRAERAAPLVAALREQLLRLQKSTLPKSATGQAVNYTLSLWPRLTVFLTHPVVELSNNLAENSMRGVALGRKNWIHLGSENAGPKVAAILSIAETCRREAIPMRDYLLAVLPGLADRTRSEVPGLTPTHWRAATTEARRGPLWHWGWPFGYDSVASGWLAMPICAIRSRYQSMPIRVASA
jgi:hypothetical protein